MYPTVSGINPNRVGAGERGGSITQCGIFQMRSITNSYLKDILVIVIYSLMIYTIKFTWGSSDFFFGPASPPLKSRPSLLQTNDSEVLEALLDCWWCYLLEICVEGGDEAVLRVFAKLTLSPPIQFHQCFSVFLRHQNPILDFTFTFSA